MHPKLTGKTIFTNGLHWKFFQIGFLIHFSYWNLFHLFPTWKYFQGNKFPEFNNPSIASIDNYILWIGRNVRIPSLPASRTP